MCAVRALVIRVVYFLEVGMPYWGTICWSDSL